MTDKPSLSGQHTEIPFQHGCALQADFRGLKCPLPVLKARRSLGQISSGQHAEFLADDPASPLDMAHFCETEGHVLLVSDEQDGVFVFVVKKSKGKVSLWP